MAAPPLRAGILAVLLGGCAMVPERPNGHRLVAVPAGTYLVGAAGHARNPRRLETVRAFEIASTETTNAQFARFVESTRYVTDAEARGYGMVFEEGMLEWQWEKRSGACWRRPFGDDRLAAATHPDHPVTQISAEDAAAYCAWAGVRLPTVVEWEIAARAGVETLFPWGDEPCPEGLARANIWHGETHRRESPLDGFVYAAPVGRFPPNRWGLQDVIGNVFEYCVDLSSDPRAGERVAFGRGGSWWCSANACAAYNLVDIGQMDRRGSLANQGFRVAR